MFTSSMQEIPISPNSNSLPITRTHRVRAGTASGVCTWVSCPSAPHPAFGWLVCCFCNAGHVLPATGSEGPLSAQAILRHDKCHYSKLGKAGNYLNIIPSPESIQYFLTLVKVNLWNGKKKQIFAIFQMTDRSERYAILILKQTKKWTVFIIVTKKD